MRRVHEDTLYASGCAHFVGSKMRRIMVKLLTKSLHIMAVPITKGMWIGIGILVLALILIGAGTIARTMQSEEKASIAEEPALMPNTPNANDSTDTSTLPNDLGAEGTTLPSATETVPKQIVVSYMGTGFEPATLTVKVGTEVNFENESMVAMWPASNPHPVHTDLPGFDSGKAVESGGTYTYTFDKVGVWKYHNHLRWNETGTVTVIP